MTAIKIGVCIAAGPEESRDHVPSRVLLDPPYPENLPVVPSCRSCNQSFSLDEEYLACLVECARTGSVNAPTLRDQVRRILSRKTKLASRLIATRRVMGDNIVWTPEQNRVQNIVLKLARGHAAYERNEPQLDDPTILSITPLNAMTREGNDAFNNVPNTGIWPEVGSRGFHRAFLGHDVERGWIIVQPYRYRYLVEGDCIRLVIGEYLGCEVIWC